MQRWPAAPNAEPMMLSIVFPITASGITTMWFLAPPSACTRFPARAARSYTSLATAAEPTKLIPSMPGWSSSASTVSLPPFTRFTTPAGSSSPSMISKNAACVCGTCSEGLRTNVLPHAIAKGRNHIGTIAGKLNGQIAAKTPIGWRYVSQSMPRDTSSRLRPCIVVGIAQAHSTISIARATSARASAGSCPSRR